MKRAVNCGIVLALALFTVPAHAQDETERMNAVGLTLSYTVPDDLERGSGVGVSLTRLLSPLFSFEFGVEHHRFDHPDANVGGAFGEIRETPLLVTAQIRPQFGWNPYLGVGVGYYIMSYDQSSAARSLCNCEFTVDNTAVGHFVLGFDVPLNERLTVTLDTRFASGRADTTSRDLSTGVSGSDDVTLNYRKIAVGLKYWF
jgi:outer membrane protein W